MSWPGTEKKRCVISGDMVPAISQHSLPPMGATERSCASFDQHPSASPWKHQRISCTCHPNFAIRTDSSETPRVLAASSDLKCTFQRQAGGEDSVHSTKASLAHASRAGLYLWHAIQPPTTSPPSRKPSRCSKGGSMRASQGVRGVVP